MRGIICGIIVIGEYNNMKKQFNKEDAKDYRKFASILIEAANSANKVADLLENENAKDDEIEAALGVLIMKSFKIKELE